MITPNYSSVSKRVDGRTTLWILVSTKKICNKYLSTMNSTDSMFESFAIETFAC